MLGPFSSFFGLRDNPFRANPDPRYLFLTQRTKETLDQIVAAISGRKGLLLLTGEVGTGKTLLLNRLMQWLEQERIPKAFIFNSHLKASELLDLILADFGVPFNERRGTPLAHLHSWLQDRHCAGQTPVLFVDEAQGLSRRTLEELRMLLNLQTPEGSLLQIVLCGQPEFEDTLKRPELRQLSQRIALRWRTTRLTLEETQGYIDARLRVAGSSAAAVFHPEAVQALLHYSLGLPRVLNALCEESLTRAARERIRPVSGRMVGEAAHELQYDGSRPFVPAPASDCSSFSGPFGRVPGLEGTPESFSTAAPLAHDAPLEPEARVIPSLELKRLAASAAAIESTRTSIASPATPSAVPEAIPDAPRVSRAPIEFPSTRERHPQASPTSASDEMIARLASASNTPASSEPRIVERAAVPAVIATRPAVPKEARKLGAKKENDFSDRLRCELIAMAYGVKSALSAMGLASRIRLAQLQKRAVSLLGSLSGQWLAWRNENWNTIKIHFQWRNFASACLRWLRAPAHATARRRALPQLQVRAPLTESSERILAAHALRRRSLPSAGGSKVIGRLKKAPSFRTSILHWLQEPSHSLRERKPMRTSSTRLP